VFLLYSPLNQGLKHSTSWIAGNKWGLFLLYSPLNQGLKHIVGIVYEEHKSVFTLQSIKSRIETNLQQKFLQKVSGFYSTVH